MGGDPSADGACHGREQALEFMRRARSRRSIAELTDVVDAGDQVVVITRVFSADGNSTALSAALTTFRDGRLPIKMVHYPARRTPDCRGGLTAVTPSITSRRRGGKPAGEGASRRRTQGNGWRASRGGYSTPRCATATARCSPLTSAASTARRHRAAARHEDRSPLRARARARARLDRCSYGPDIRFSEVVIDQARAAGVVI
jgi:hypothetical protein